MKPILSYYGGKQRIAPKISPYIHQIPHTVYVEPFCGGAALLFEKGRPSVAGSDYKEVINDLNKEVITFYRVAKLNPDELNRLIQGTLHSRFEHGKAISIYKNPKNFSDLEVAWSVWVNLNQSFASVFNKGWAFSLKNKNNAHSTNNKKPRLPEQLKRLEQVYIECDDALKIIERWDSSETLFYIDPPYINTDQGHYEGYTEDDYKQLIELLSTIEGSFILSGYPNDIVPGEWDYVSLRAVSSAANGKTRTTENIERIERIWIIDKNKKKTNPLSFQRNIQEHLFAS